MEDEHSHSEVARLRDNEPMIHDIVPLVDSNLEKFAVGKPLQVDLSLFLLGSIFYLIELFVWYVIYITVVKIISPYFIKALLQTVDARRMENHFIHPANYHSRCEIFNESVAAFFTQVNRYDYPENE
jgi:hypothetical protein